MSSQGLFDRDIFTVGELTVRLERLIEGEFGLIWLSGEISNLRRPSSGHMYMVLKDRQAQIRAVMFRMKQKYLGFEPRDGQEVLAQGRLSIYAPRGEYQIVIEYMEPRGEGALRLAFEKLKADLAAEGLFDESRKKKLPFLPKRVALVTSPTGAAVRDFIRIARRRYDNSCLSIYPVRVQGEGAAAEIAKAVRDLNKWGDYDLIVLTRGGGSLEDLWAFNEEITARSIAESAIPVVSAVGHEVDFTISDFVADLRAPTPSGAAEFIFREKRELQAHLDNAAGRLESGVRGRLNLVREKMAHIKTRLGDPSRLVADHRMRLDDINEKLTDLTRRNFKEKRRTVENMKARLAPSHPRMRFKEKRVLLDAACRSLAGIGNANLSRSRDKLSGLAGRLGGLSPLAVLDRGYALARKMPEKKLIRSSNEVVKGDLVNLKLSRGELDLIVDEVFNDKNG